MFGIERAGDEYSPEDRKILSVPGILVVKFPRAVKYPELETIIFGFGAQLNGDVSIKSRNYTKSTVYQGEDKPRVLERTENIAVAFSTSYGGLGARVEQSPHEQEMWYEGFEFQPMPNINLKNQIDSIRACREYVSTHFKKEKKG